MRSPLQKLHIALDEGLDRSQLISDSIIFLSLPYHLIKERRFVVQQT